MRHSYFFLVFLILGSLAQAGGKSERHYLKTYVQSRDAFRVLSESAKKALRDVEVDKIIVPSEKDNDLTVDSLYIPAQKETKGLVIISSGVHGSEAFAASAIQRMLLEDWVLAAKTDTQETGYLFLHAINPYGYKYWRRVSENNVDLNRNFSVDKKLFSKKNEIYNGIDGLLNPRKPASSGWFPHLGFLLGTARQLLSISQDELNQGILSGQWKIKDGIFFGGFDFEPQKEGIEKWLMGYSDKYEKVLILDLHTGYGVRGYMHLLPNPPDKKEIATRWKTVFGDYRVETTEGAEFYSNEGDFSTYASRLLEDKKKTTVPMCIEYGTMDTQNLKGGIASLSRTILENQLHHHGARNESSRKIIRNNFEEMFYPSQADWRQAVMNQSAMNVPIFFDRFKRLLK